MAIYLFQKNWCILILSQKYEIVHDDVRNVEVDYPIQSVEAD